MTNQPVCTITSDAYGDVPVIRVTGDVDVATSPDLRGVLLDPAIDAAAPLIVDMGAVTFLDSTGLSALVAAHARFTRAGGDLRIVVDAPHVLRVLHVTGLDEALSIFPSVHRAATGVAA